MKKICYLSGVISIIISLVCLVNKYGTDVFVLQFLAAMVIFFCYPRCKEKYQFQIIQFFAIWTLLYQVLFAVLKYTNVVDIMKHPSYITFEFVIPFLVAVILKASVKMKGNDIT